MLGRIFGYMLMNMEMNMILTSRFSCELAGGRRDFGCSVGEEDGKRRRFYEKEE